MAAQAFNRVTVYHPLLAVALGPLALQHHFPSADKAAWEQTVRRQGQDPQGLAWHAPDGFVADPLCTAAHVPPGAGPLWSCGAWQSRVDLQSGQGNAAALAALNGGADALGFCGHDDGELTALLQSVPLNRIPLHWDGGNAALLDRLDQAAQTLGFDSALLRGTLGLGDAFAPHALHEVARLCRAAQGTRWRTVRIDTRPYHRSGASLVQELAFATAATASLLSQLTAQGLRVSEVASQLFYEVSIGTSYLPEVAKLRALRHLVAQVMQAFGAPPEPIFIHAEASLRSHAEFDPATNLVRAGSQAMSAIVGGCDTLSIPLEDQTLACHLQLLLRHEAHLDLVADPGAGAYHLEALTDELGAKAWSMVQNIETQGGFAKAHRQGTIARIILKSREHLAQAASTGAMVLVGTNKYAAPVVTPPAACPSHPAGPEPFRAAARFDRIRRRSKDLQAALGRRPTVHISLAPEAADTLHTLAERVLCAGGFADRASCPDHADLVVQVGGHTPHSMAPVVSVTNQPDGSALNIHPGCDMARVLERILARLFEYLDAPHAP